MAAGLAAMNQMTPSVYALLDMLGTRLRDGANTIFRAAGESAQMTGDGSLFRIITNTRPIANFRDAILDTAPPARMAAMHRYLLDEGIIIS